MTIRRPALVLSVLLPVLGAGCSFQDQDTVQAQRLDRTVQSLLDHHRSQVEEAEGSGEPLRLKAALIRLETGLEWANNLATEGPPETILAEKVEAYRRLVDVETQLGNDDRARHYRDSASELCDGWDLGAACDEELE